MTLFKDRTFNVTNEEELPIDIRYGKKDWGMVEALREILSNMLDTKASYSFSYEDGVATIADEGNGLPMSAFVLGASSKDNDSNVIGQFGDGLKLSLVTALRNEKRVSIQTMGYGCEIKKVHSKKYNSEVMLLQFNDNTIDKGTIIKMECSKEEFDAATDLFLQFKDDYRKLDNGIFLPAGYICIMGLKTEERQNLLYSYDLKDKSSTNRDRNAIKSVRLKDSMRTMLNGMKNQKAIRIYLDGLTSTPEADEFKIELNPKSNELWLTTIYKTFGDKCCYSTTIENDMKADANGFKVIPCPTKHVKNTFANIGLMSSKAAGKGVKTKDLVVDEGDKIVYPISKSYIESWTLLDAGREIYANASDSINGHGAATVAYEDGYCVIRDDGAGIPREGFVIGNSEKTEQEIGMFGEGLKMAGIVMAREDRDMSINTVGYTYIPVFQELDKFHQEVFVILIEANSRTKGTEIRFKATEEEVTAIKSLFIELKADIVMEKGEKVDVILNETGYVYVNGLQATSVDSLYSYNIKDKEIVTTRDRRHVNIQALEEIVKDYYNSTTNTDVIRTYISTWEEIPSAFEYRLIIKPANFDIWETVINEEYPAACIASHYDMEANFIAKQAGYKLLFNVPAYLRDMLEQVLPPLESIAEKFRKKGIMFNNRIVYPITQPYVNRWSEFHAISELIANAIDANADGLDIRYENGNAIIEDFGPGFGKKNLLIGESTSREIGTANGTFGEGLKMACLVLANLAPVIIETKGFTAIATIEHDKQFDSDLLVMSISENNREVGTKISCKTDMKTLENAKRRFLILNDEFKKIEDAEHIYTPGGSLFVNGMEIQKINSMYSYDLTGNAAKYLLNRDRTGIDSYQSTQLIAEIVISAKNKSFISDILQISNVNSEDLSIADNLYLFTQAKRTYWKKVADSIYGKMCLPSVFRDVHTESMAEDAGYEIIHVNSKVASILSNIGFPTAEDAVKKSNIDTAIGDKVTLRNMNTDERALYEKICDAVRVTLGEKYLRKMKVAEYIKSPDTQKTTYGIYVPAERCFYINRMLLNGSYSMGFVLGIINHEIIHMETNHDDITREFENDLSSALGSALEKVYQLMTK